MLVIIGGNYFNKNNMVKIILLYNIFMCRQYFLKNYGT